MDPNASTRERKRKHSEPSEGMTATEAEHGVLFYPRDYFEDEEAISDVCPQSEIILSPSTLDKPLEEPNFQSFTSGQPAQFILGSQDEDEDEDEEEEEEEEEEEGQAGAGAMSAYRVDSEVILTAATLEDDGTSGDASSRIAGEKEDDMDGPERFWSPPRSFFAHPAGKLGPEVLGSRKDSVQNSDENAYSFSGTLMKRQPTPSVTPSPSSEAFDRLLAQSVARSEDQTRGPFKRIIGCFKESGGDVKTCVNQGSGDVSGEEADGKPPGVATPGEGSDARKQLAAVTSSIGPYIVRFHVPVEDLETFVVEKVRKYSLALSDSDSQNHGIDPAGSSSSSLEQGHPFQVLSEASRGFTAPAGLQDSTTRSLSPNRKFESKENLPDDAQNSTEVSPPELHDDGHKRKISFTVNGVSIIIVIPTAVIPEPSPETSGENTDPSVIFDVGRESDREDKDTQSSGAKGGKPVILITVPREAPERNASMDMARTDHGDTSTLTSQRSFMAPESVESDASLSVRRRKNAVCEMSRSSTSSSSEFDPASLYRKLQALGREQSDPGDSGQENIRLQGRGRSRSMTAFVPATSSYTSRPYTEDSERRALAHLRECYSSFQHGCSTLDRYSGLHPRLGGANLPSPPAWLGPKHELQSIQEIGESRGGDGGDGTSSPSGSRRLNVGRSVSMSAAGPLAFFRRRSSAANPATPSGHQTHHGGKVKAKVSKSSSTRSYHTLRGPPRWSRSGPSGRPRSASQCSGMSFWDHSERTSTTGRRTRQLSMEIGEEWEGAQHRDAPAGEDDGLILSAFGDHPMAGAWSAGERPWGGRGPTGTTAAARRLFREKLREFMYPELYKQRQTVTPSASSHPGPDPRSEEDLRSGDGAQEKGGDGGGGDASDHGKVNLGYTDEESHTTGKGVSGTGKDGFLKETDPETALIQKRKENEAADDSGWKDEDSISTPESCTVAMELEEKDEHSVDDPGAAVSASSKLQNILSVALRIDRDAVARQKPNPYNDINHMFHSALHCPCFFFFCLVCCSPGVYFMQRSDRNFVKGLDHLAKREGRRATALYVVGTLIGISLMAVTWAMLYLFVIAEFL